MQKCHDNATGVAKNWRLQNSKVSYQKPSHFQQHVKKHFAIAKKYLTPKNKSLKLEEKCEECPPHKFVGPPGARRRLRSEAQASLASGGDNR